MTHVQETPTQFRRINPYPGLMIDAAAWRDAHEYHRDQVRLHVLPAFEHYTLAEITTGRVDWFLKSQAAISSSRARQSRC